MEARSVKQHAESRAAEEGRGLALDLTASEVVLHEGAAGGWRRFAGVALDDPEFLEVMALLREEAESAVGRGRPVRLWLPGEQVLRLRARIEAPEPDARRAAAFRIASRETGHGPEELAVALGPGGPGGETTILVTYAATWHEARDYAARWGFVPGPVSTRHHAEAFGPEGPEFQVGKEGGEAQEEAGEKRTDKTGPRVAWLAGVLVAAVLAGLPEAGVARAPAAAPLPEARIVAAKPSEAMPDGAHDRTPAEATRVSVIPRARPEEAGPPEPAGTGARPLGPAAVPTAGAIPGATAPAMASVGLITPLPRGRPAGLVPALRIDRVALVGILNLDSGREALLRLPDGEFVTLRAGEALEGWEVTEIGPDTMQLRRGAETRTLLLVSG